ncbi:MAG: NAD-dependent epimerase/dehydratase family protein [Bdellovibrionota bacterium]
MESEVPAKPDSGPRKKKKSASNGTLPALAITGASGFLGSLVLSRLRGEERFEKIVVLDLEKPSLPIRKTKFYKVDLTDPACDARLAEIFQKEGVRQVLHLSFFGSPRRDAGYAHEVEVIGTLHLLHACAQHKVEKLATVTSTLAYGARPDNPNFLTEESPLRASKRFSHLQNKVEAEGLIASFAEKHPETHVTVLRRCMTLGPKTDTYITRFFSRPVVPMILGYDPLLQFVHEDDVLDALSRVIQSNTPAGVYNIVGEGLLPLSTLLRIGGKWRVGQPGFVLNSVVGALWLAGAGEIPPEFLDYLRYLCIADGEKAREKLDYRPRHSTKDTWLSFTGEARVRSLR